MTKMIKEVCHKAIKENTDGDSCQRLALKVMSDINEFPASRLKALIYQECTDAFNAKIIEMELVRKIYNILEEEA